MDKKCILGFGECDGCGICKNSEKILKERGIEIVEQTENKANSK